MFVCQYPEFKIAIINQSVIPSDYFIIFIHKLYVTILLAGTLPIIISNYGVEILGINTFIKKALKINIKVWQNTIVFIIIAEHFEKPFVIKNSLVTYIASNQF